MKLSILLLNILPIPIIGTNINIQGSLFPSPKDQKFFKYHFTICRFQEIEFLEDIPIIPHTSISVIVLDTKLLHEKQSELVELDECVSKICSEIHWESDGGREISSSQMKPKLSNQYKPATLFTAGSYLDLYGSEWENCMDDFKYKNAALNKLKEQLEIYLPKRSIKAYDIEFSNFEYYFELQGYSFKFSAGSQAPILSGWLNLHLRIPYSQEFLEETKRGLLVALASIKNNPNQEENKIKKATRHEERIRDQDSNRNYYFDFVVERPIEIEKTADISGKPSYNIFFQEFVVNGLEKDTRKPDIYFTNYLLFWESPWYNDSTAADFDCIGLYRKNDIEEVNSLLDEYFETPRPDTTKSTPDINDARPDTTESGHGKRNLVISLTLFPCLAITIFLLGYYYKRKNKKCSNRVCKKQKGRKKSKLYQ